jgi:large subunit ribosomal protein L33
VIPGLDPGTDVRAALTSGVDMAKKAPARDYVSLECPECRNRNYRTSKRIKGNTTKLNLSKFCPFCRKHTKHVERKK